MIVYLIVNAGPDHDQTETYSTEALARAAFAEELEVQADDSCDGFDPGQPTPMLLRAEVLLSSEFVTFATAEEDSENGARCRACGWDYLATLTAFEPEKAPLTPAEGIAAMAALGIAPEDLDPEAWEDDDSAGTGPASNASEEE